MATTLNISARASLAWTYTNTLTQGDTTNSNSYSFSDNLTNGTSADTADLLYIGAHTIAASGSLDLDLAGAVTNPFGTTITFARVKCVYVGFQSDNTATDISIGADGTAPVELWFGDPASDEEKVHSTGVALHYRADAVGWPVTATTADILEITNLDAASSAKILVGIVGCSA